MWAMIPMLRVRFRGVLRIIVCLPRGLSGGMQTAGPRWSGRWGRGLTAPGNVVQVGAGLDALLLVLDGALERGQRLAAGLLLDDLHRVVDDALGHRPFAAEQDLVDHLRDEHGVVHGVGHQLAPRSGSFAGHALPFLLRAVTAAG